MPFLLIKKKMEILKEHKLFRNQLIIGTILLLTIGLISNIFELIFFGSVLGLIALFNIFTYNENVKDYKKLNDRKNNID